MVKSQIRCFASTKCSVVLGASEWLE